LNLRILQNIEVNFTLTVSIYLARKVVFVYI